MWGWHYYGFFWGIPWIIFWLFVLFFFWGRGHRHGWRHFDHEKSAQEILSERFAKGEIDEDEYKKRLDVLTKAR